MPASLSPFESARQFAKSSTGKNVLAVVLTVFIGIPVLLGIIAGIGVLTKGIMGGNGISVGNPVEDPTVNPDMMPEMQMIGP